MRNLPSSPSLHPISLSFELLTPYPPSLLCATPFLCLIPACLHHPHRPDPTRLCHSSHHSSMYNKIMFFLFNFFFIPLVNNKNIISLFTCIKESYFHCFIFFSPLFTKMKMLILLYKWTTKSYFLGNDIFGKS